jgi:hypothetical protein
MKQKKALRIVVIVVAILLVIFMAVMPILSYLVYAAEPWSPALETAVTVGDSLVLSRNVFRNAEEDSRLTEHILTYRPDGDVRPLVVYGHDIYGAASLKRAAEYAAEETGRRVVAAVNGDFFTVETGVSIGLVIREGTLRTSDDGTRNTLAFDSEGRASIGVSGLSVSVRGDTLGDALKTVHLNKPLSTTSGVVLFDGSFEATNKDTSPKVSVYLSVKSGEMRVGTELVCEVLSTNETRWEDALRSDYLVLSARSDTVYTSQLNALKTLAPGDTVTIAISANDFLTGAENAVGGGDILVENGVNVAPAGENLAPRTAAGIRRDGTVVFYTVDGRQENHSVGMTYAELADRLIELGCVDALNLDGGGSTTLEAVRPGYEELAVINSPSTGYLRNCANYILFMSGAEGTGEAARLHLYPLSTVMLPGTSFTVDVRATDDAYLPVGVNAGGVSYETNGLGEMNGTVFTAGMAPGDGKLAARYESASGDCRVTVTDKVDAITILNQAAGTEPVSITLKAGGKVDLTAKAFKNGLEVVASDTSFEWSVNGPIGTVSPEGVLEAYDFTGEGTVVCSFGDTKASLDVKVVPEGFLLADFEQDRSFDGRVGTGVEASVLSTNREFVRFGQSSLALSYDFDLTQDGASAFLPFNMLLVENATDLSFWVYGDGSGNEISAEFGTFVGLSTVSAGKLDFTGWKEIRLPVPVSARTFTNLNITRTEGGASKGTIYVDQILSSRGEYVDHDAPVVLLSVDGRNLTGLVSDDMDGEIPASRVAVTYDGKPLAVNYSLEGQSFTAVLPAADAYDHQVSATVRDLSGNLSRVFLTLPAEPKDESEEGTGESGGVYAAEIPFIDTAGHWSESYANYLYQQHLSEGSETPDGIVYRPEDYMNRQEIAVMLARWLGVMGKYDDVVLPYSDTAEIADWALPAAKAMYALGIIQGSENGDGTVSFLPASLLSREGIMTMIGRIQDKGYAESDMDFTDADKVSGWALPYVRSLVGQKVITGDAGRLRPLDPVKRGEAAKIICCLY